MTFAQDWQMPLDLSSDFDSLHTALDQPARGGLTSLHDAIFAGLKLVEEGSGRPMVLVFTDGFTEVYRKLGHIRDFYFAILIVVASVAVMPRNYVAVVFVLGKRDVLHLVDVT